jgi:hypothetical protein
MPNAASCPTCGLRLTIPEGQLGSQAKCPQCNGILTFPHLIPSVTPAGEPDDTTGDQKPCPFCAEPVLRNARVCRYCGRTIDAALRATEEAKQGVRPVVVNAVASATASSGDSSSGCMTCFLVMVICTVLTAAAIGVWFVGCCGFVLLSPHTHTPAAKTAPPRPAYQEGVCPAEGEFGICCGEGMPDLFPAQPDDILRYRDLQGAGDTEGINRMEREGRLVRVEQGTRVLVLRVIRVNKRIGEHSIIAAQLVEGKNDGKIVGMSSEWCHRLVEQPK